VTFKAEITLGQVVELVVFIIAIVGTVRKLGALEQKLNTMYDWFLHAVVYREQQEPRIDRFVR
jgi:hypothetical protein